MIVNTLDDAVAPDGLCSLREALSNANFDLNTYVDCGPGRGRDRIVFDVTPNGTITLAAVGFSISDSVTLVGSTSTQVSIDAGGAARHFLINDSNPDHQIKVSMDSLRLVNGLAADGGAIQSYEDLVIDRMVFENNTANGSNRYGGALSMRAGALQVTRSSFLGNHATGAPGSGGALGALAGTSVYIANSAFLDNTAVGSGGGVYLAGVDPATLQRITFARNQSGSPGGALAIAGASVANGKNLTFSANQGPGQGGAVAVLGASATATIDHSTFFGNVSGGGSNALRLASGAQVTLSDSLLEDGDVAGPQCSNSGSTLNLAGTNLVDDASCGVAATASTSISLDPELLANGGDNQTHALLEGSVAIDAGTDCVGTGIDQRGYSRSRDGDLDGSVSCDVGAYEFTPIIVTTVADVLNGGDGECSLREAIANANNNRLLYGSCEPGGGPDLIAFDLPAPSTIVLGGVLPQITTPMTIRGPGRDQLTIDANAAGRHFIISNADPSLIDVSLTGMTLDNARAVGSGGSIYSLENLMLQAMRFSGNEATATPGGAVAINLGTASIANSEFIGNSASDASNGRGGAIRIAASASADILDSLFQGNDAATYGGAIAVDDGGALTGSGLLFDGNHADADGGALDVDGATATGELSAARVTNNTSAVFGGGVSARNGANLSLHRVTLDANHTDGVGGGASIRLNSTMDGDNLTFSGNTAGNEGGGLYAGASLTLVALTGSTFFGNEAVNAGKSLRASQASIGLVNSLLEDNDVAGDLCSGVNISANAGTVADDASCNGGIVGSSLNLGPLADYGFIAPSHGLLPWSSAVDVTADCAGLVIDQRGESRPSGAGCDAGAFEVHNIAPETNGELFVSGETQNVSGLNLLANEIDPDNTGTMELVQVGYTDINGQPQTKPIQGVVFNPFIIQPGIQVYVARNGDLAYAPGTALQYLAAGQTLDLGFSYLVSDGYSSSGTSVTLRFNGQDTPPVLADDAKTVARDSAATMIDVLVNDSDVDGGTNTITAVSQPFNGSVLIAGDALSLTYQPDATYCNDGMPTDDFTYTVNGSLTANVAVTVSCGPVGIDLSIAVSGDAVAAPGASVSYQVLAQNIGDVDGTASIGVLFDPRLTGVSWTCLLTPGGACPSGTGDISTEIALPAGVQVQFDVTATTPAAASNTPLSVSAAVDAVGDTDVDTGNNVANFETETALFLDGFEDTTP